MFDMPRMYAMLIVLFVLAIGANALIGRLGGLDSIKQKLKRIGGDRSVRARRRIEAAVRPDRAICVIAHESDERSRRIRRSARAGNRSAIDRGELDLRAATARPASGRPY